jgi:hypothetical protein
MKVYLIINTYDAWSDEIFFKSSIYIASTLEKAIEYITEHGLDKNSIKEVELDKDEVSLCGNDQRAEILTSESKDYSVLDKNVDNESIEYIYFDNEE